MKDKFFKYALVVVFSAMAYFAIAAYDKKDACAEGECLEIVSVAMEFVGAIAAIMDGDISGISALSFVGQYIDTIKNMAESYIGFYTDMLETEAEETKEMMQKIARQHRAANIAVAGQWGSIFEAGAMIEKTTRYQRSQLDTLSSRYPAPSNQVCRQTNEAIRINHTENYVDFERAVSRETSRRRNSVVRGSLNQWGGETAGQSSMAAGPAVRNAMLMETTKRYCFDDEQKGNTRWNGASATCYLRGGADFNANSSDSAPNGSYVRYLTGDMPMGYFGPNWEIPYMKEMILPPPLTKPIPRSVESDITVQDQYQSFSTILARTNLNDAIVDYLAAQRSGFIMSDQTWRVNGSNGPDPLIPPNYSGVIFPCKRALDMVRQTYTDVYGHHILGSAEESNMVTSDECPSMQTLDHASMLSVSSSSGLASILALEEGNMKQAEFFTYILRHRLDFNVLQKEQMITLQIAIDRLADKRPSAVGGSSTGREQ